MNITELEKEIIKALDINSKIYWDTDPELDPNKEFKYLKKGPIFWGLFFK